MAVWIVVVGGFFGFFFAWSIGANDLANAMGTSVGSKALTYRGAILVGGLFESLGAFGMGSSVSQTFKTLVKEDAFTNDDLFQLVMMTTLFGTAVWLTLATYYSLPVSTTHSIVGAMVGVGLIAAGSSSISTWILYKTFISWVTSPIAGGIFSYLLYYVIYTGIIISKRPFRNARILVPFFSGLCIFFIVLFLLLDGPKSLEFPWEWWFPYVVALSFAAAASFYTFLRFRSKLRRNKGLGVSVSFLTASNVDVMALPKTMSDGDEMLERNEAPTSAVDIMEYSGPEGAEEQQVDPTMTELEREIADLQDEFAVRKPEKAILPYTTSEEDVMKKLHLLENDVESSIQKQDPLSVLPVGVTDGIVKQNEDTNEELFVASSSECKKNDVEKGDVDGNVIVGAEFELNPQIEKSFKYLMVLTAVVLAFSHGGNNVANAIGPFSAIIETQTGEVQDSIPVYMLLAGGAGIVVGLATWGYRVMRTIGSEITKLTFSRGFAAQLGAAVSVLICTHLGVPVSTTHVLVGSVTGVALVNDKKNINWKTLRNIGVSWLVTIPAAAFFSIVLYLSLFKTVS